MEETPGNPDKREEATSLLCDAIDVAKALRLSRSKVYKLMTDGTLPSVRIGSRRFVRRADLENFVSELSAA